MKAKKAVIWQLINGKDHPLVTKEDMKIANVMPIVNNLFPGVNYYSFTGFHEILWSCAVPALEKRFPEMKAVDASTITVGDELDITEFLPSEGYEWQDSERWQTKFKELLAA